MMGAMDQGLADGRPIAPAATIYDTMAELGSSRLMLLHDPPSGLRAMIVIDDLTLGPAAGGIRTLRYPRVDDAIRDAQDLAHAMTLKCAIAGLDAGGAKTVVLDHDDFDRAAGFRRLGRFVEDLGGLYRCAGDLGTTAQDLENVAAGTAFVNIAGERLGASTASGVLQCIRACVDERGGGNLKGLRVAVQGCGLIGSSVARVLKNEGALPVLADVDRDRAEALAVELGCAVIPTSAVLTADVDVISPCATGGLLTIEAVPDISAWAICGGANNQLKEPEAGARLKQAGILFMPDFLASAGGVIDGIALPVMKTDPAPLLAGLYDTARAVLKRSAATGEATTPIAEEIARERISARRELRLAGTFRERTD